MCRYNQLCRYTQLLTSVSLVCWVSDRRLSGVVMSRTGEAGPRLLVWTN